MIDKSVKMGFRVIRYILWPVITFVVLFLLGIYSLSIHVGMGILLLVVAVLNLIIFVILFLLSRNRLSKEIISTAIQVSEIQKEHLENFDFPHSILNAEGVIIWCNNAFYDVIDEEKVIGKNITYFMEDIVREKFPEINQSYETEIKYKNDYYRVGIKKNRIERHSLILVDDQAESFFYTIYLYNITHEIDLNRINTDQKAVIGYIYIDNYEEVLSGMEEVRKPLLIALIDRNINRFAKSVDGVIKKIEKDRYILFFQRRFLKVLEEERFNILDDIREISIGNELPITISIGLGVHKDDYAQGMAYAGIAIDLALGRGGDQAVIKNNDKFTFYGGKTRGVEKNTRVKARIKAYAFKELINEADKVIIMGHTKSDLDALGAAVGVYACATMLNKEAYIVLEEVTMAVKVLYDNIKESDDFPEDMIISGSKALEMVTPDTVVVVVDVNRPSYVDFPKLLDYTNKLVVFDHHRVSSEYIENTVLSYIEPYASSTCEMVTEIIRYFSDKVKLNPLEADALFSGISLDTKNFVIKTGVKTFEAAAFLRRNGADLIRVRKFFKNDMDTYKARAEAVRATTIYKEHMAISISPSDVANPTLVAAQAADELLSISAIKASFVLTHLEDTVYISARSFDAVNVQLIMEKLGGGGHLSVAGAQLKAVTIDQGIEQLKQAIDEYLNEGDEEI